MLACVCQPADPGIFRRSPVPLGAPPLKITKALPGRTVRLTTPVITDPPKSATEDSNDKMKKKHKKCKRQSDKDKCSENGDGGKEKRKTGEFEKVEVDV